MNSLRQQSAPVIARFGRFFRRLLPVACAAAALATPAAANEELDGTFSRSSLIIESSGGACYRFDVYLALDPEQRRRGLMHVRHLDAMSGMLFVYPDSAMHSMWMKNTLIPLDMLFIGENGVIASIVADTEPQSLASVASREPVRFVLELNAGAAARLGIVPGDRMLWEGDAARPPSED